MVHPDSPRGPDRRRLRRRSRRCREDAALTIDAIGFHNAHRKYKFEKAGEVVVDEITLIPESAIVFSTADHANAGLFQGTKTVAASGVDREFAVEVVKEAWFVRGVPPGLVRLEFPTERDNESIVKEVHLADTEVKIVDVPFR